MNQFSIDLLKIDSYKKHLIAIITFLTRNTLFALLLSFGLATSSAYAYETFTVTDYGAFPNDGLDDTAGINAAIQAAPYGALVYMPAGTYEITSAILPKSGMKLAGAGQNDTILKFEGTYAYESAMIHMENAELVTIEDMTLDANYNNTVFSGISVIGGQGHFFISLTIKNFSSTTGWGPFGIILYGVTDSGIGYSTIKDIAINDEWGTAIQLQYSPRIEIAWNIISNTGRGGILCRDSSHPNIHDNIVSGSGRGLSVELYWCHGASVRSNELDYPVTNSGSEGTIIE